MGFHVVRCSYCNNDSGMCIGFSVDYKYERCDKCSHVTVGKHKYRFCSVDCFDKWYKENKNKIKTYHDK